MEKVIFMMDKNCKSRDNELINEIKKEITERKFSISDVANATKISPSTLYAILNGVTSPRLDTFQNICKALDLKVTLTPNDGSMSPNETFAIKIENLPTPKKDFLHVLVDMLDRYDSKEEHSEEQNDC